MDDRKRAGNVEAAKMFLADYEAGRPCMAIGNGWLIRFAAHIIEPEPCPIAGYDQLPLKEES